MANIEERLTALEHEHTALKEKIELQTIAIGALVNKAALERLNEKYDNLFKVLINHDRFTNEQLAELRGQQTELRDQQTELEGKVVGLQTEMRQGFEAVNARFETVATKDDLKAVNARLEQQDGKLQQILDLLTGQGPQS